jgi:hypothetical protein
MFKEQIFSTISIFCLSLLISGNPLLAAEREKPVLPEKPYVKILGTHDAFVNLNGQLLGFYRDHTPLIIESIPEGINKLYIKSTITEELKVYQFEVTKEAQNFDYKATFAPKDETVNNQAQRRTGVIVALAASEILGDSTSGKQDRRKVIGGLAVANELIPGVVHDRNYSKQYGNTIEVKTQVDVDINVDGTGSKAFKVNEGKRFHNLTSGWHKLYIRNIPTQELRVFKIEFPESGTRTVTIRPDFAPPMGESVNAQARRRTGILGALLGNEVAGDKGTGRSDRRKVIGGAALLNELIGTNRDKVRKTVTLNINNLPELPMTIEDYDRLYKNPTGN